MKSLRITKIFALIVVLLVSSCGKDSPTPGPDPEPNPDPNPPTNTELKFPRKEMRAAWIATVWSIDWPKSTDMATQKQQYIDILDRLKELKFNTVFFQVKGLGDAFYNSPYEPWSAAITGTRGKDPGYDVLKFLIDEAHARDIEFHAWMNPYRISSTPPYPDLHPSIDPSWVKDYPGSIRMYNPALPEVRQRLNDIVKDLITKYDVDGIHFDDYFYPSGVTHDDDAEFSQYGSGYTSKAAFRRGNVDKAIEGVYNTIKSTKPQVVFSVSPAANKDHNYNSLYADVAKWTQEGWVDILIPQLYQEIGNSFNPFEGNLSIWSQFRGKSKLVIGIGFYKFGDPTYPAFQNTQELVNQFDLVRKNNYTVGTSIYNTSSILANKIGITDKLADLYKANVLMPFAGREVAAAPTTPTNLALNGNELSWSGGGSNVRYAVYYFSSLTAEGELIEVTRSTKATVTKAGYYCVSAVNVDNVESKATNPIEKK